MKRNWSDGRRMSGQNKLQIHVEKQRHAIQREKGPCVASLNQISPFVQEPFLQLQYRV